MGIRGEGEVGTGFVVDGGGIAVVRIAVVDSAVGRIVVEIDWYSVVAD